MLLYECSDDFPRSNISYEGTYDSPDMPPAVVQCAGPSTIAGWAIGGKVLAVVTTCCILACSRSVGGERGKRKTKGRLKQEEAH